MSQATSQNSKSESAIQPQNLTANLTGWTQALELERRAPSQDHPPLQLPLEPGRSALPGEYIATELQLDPEIELSADCGQDQNLKPHEDPQADPGPQKHSQSRAFLEPKKLLMITSIAGAANCGASLATLLKFSVDVVATRREGLTAMRGRDYAAVIVDDTITASDPSGAELLRKHAGMAIVLEVNLAISGVARMSRDVRAELQRREREQGTAMRLACSALESELRTTVAGLLLHSQLALAEPGLSAQLSTRLQQVVQLAGNLRRRLEQPSS